MPVIDIYRNGEKIGSEKFRHNFYIVEDLNDKLYWERDEEQGKNKRGGVIHLWIQPSIVGHRLSFVRPDWQLMIDDVQLPQKFYDTVEITGKHVRLRYGEYEFEGQFPKTE